MVVGLNLGEVVAHALEKFYLGSGLVSFRTFLSWDLPYGRRKQC